MFKKLLDKVDGGKFYAGVGALVITALGEHFFPGSFLDMDLTDLKAVEGQGFMAYMLWAFRSAMKKMEM